MINLLPPEEKAKLLSEKRKKLIVILGITAIIPLVCLILILLSIKFFMLKEIDAQKIVLEDARKEYQTPDFLIFKDIIQKSDKVLANLATFYKKEIYIGSILDIISTINRPQDLYLTDISLTRTKDQKIKAVISGFSKSRDDLLLFQKSIQEHPELKNVSFSPESWVNPQNVKFGITFEITK